ncbi:MAG TPA: alanine--glyoxylate aminotransferase family protein [Anaerolineales bacterium]|nr:alanine--glyoxylate aminotransferase family protein [Anaerolineales bacterium]
MKHVKLYTPGPGDVDEDVLSSLATPVIRHYGPEWMEIYNELQGLLKLVFKTKNEIFFVPGPASALLDMAIGSLLANDEKIIVGVNGFFGERLAQIADGYGLKTIPHRAPLGKPLDPQVLEELLQQHPDTKAVALVHHETGTTVLNPVKELALLAHKAGKAVVVDAVSSLGGTDVCVDEWGIDVCVTTPNKCLEAVPGIGFISVSPRAWRLVDSLPQTNHGWYLNLKTWRHYATEWGTWHPTPVTLPTNVILAVRTSLQKIVEMGLEAHFEKYRKASQSVRTGLRHLGFEMFVDDAYASPIVTGVSRRPEFELDEMSRWLVEQRDIAIGGGLGELSGKMFRVGHLGKASTREYLVDFLFAIEEFLRLKGFPIPPGAGLAGL